MACCNPIKLKAAGSAARNGKWPCRYNSGGAAMAACGPCIGEGAIDKDPNLDGENAKVKECQLLKDMIGAFRKDGQIILQVQLR